MALTKLEEQAIRNVIDRLKQRNCGCSFGPNSHETQAVKAINVLPQRVEAVSRIYLDTWVIPGLELLLPEKRNVKLAVGLSGK